MQNQDIVVVKNFSVTNQDFSLSFQNYPNPKIVQIIFVDFFAKFFNIANVKQKCFSVVQKSNIYKENGKWNC